MQTVAVISRGLLLQIPQMTNKRVAYYYDSMLLITKPLINVLDEVGNYNYGPGHPMKPHRIRMVHNLLVNYGVYRHLQIYVSHERVFLFIKIS